MSIYGAMFSGVTGLYAQSQALGMISDNISNVNTVGYKHTRAQFSTLVTRSASPTNYSPGGVRSTPFQLTDRQGLLQASDSATDIAVSGEGFFVVNEVANPTVGDDYIYTRAGSFFADADGNLRNQAGFFLQAWQTDADGVPIGGGGTGSVLTDLETVNVANLAGVVEATENVELGANVPADATVLTDAATSPPWPAVPANVNAAVAGGTVAAPGSPTANEAAVVSAIQQNSYPVTVQVFDSLGVAYNMTMRFVKDDGGGDWQVYMSDLARASDGFRYDGTNWQADQNTATINPDVPASWTRITPAAALNFDANGLLTGGTVGADVIRSITPTAMTTAGGAAVNIPAVNGANWGNGTSLDVKFGEVGQANGVTQFSTDYLVNRIDQDGVQFGAFTGVTINETGVITAVFDNGRSLPIYKIPLATFPNYNGLESRNGNVFIETDRSGDYFLREANVGGAGEIISGSLESSTVDLAEEFTNMIITQRAYSAAGKVITTSDEMLEELVRLKR